MPKRTPKKKEEAAAPEEKPLIVHQPDAEESALIVEFNREFLKIHYEPEHTDDILCWCKPESRVHLGQLYVNHREQRVMLRALFVEFLTKMSSLHAHRNGQL